MTTQQVQIDFTKIKDIADKGVRRTSVFMGIGINTVLDNERVNYELTKITQIQLMPNDVSLETHKHFKDEFSLWIIGNGLRELIETFKVFLDSLHHNCLLMAFHKGKLSSDENKSFDKKYPEEGLPDKLIHLKDRFNITPKHPDYLKTINKARNCLTHRRGIVEPVDCNDGDVLKINWLGIDIFIEEPNGKRTFIYDMPDEGLLLQQGGIVKLQFIERAKAINRGNIVNFSPRELAEICHYFLMESNSTSSSAIDFAKSIGIPFSRTGAGTETVK